MNGYNKFSGTKYNFPFKKITLKDLERDFNLLIK